MCVRFSLPNGHCGAALEGQHRDRKAQEQSEEQAHHVSMVPQIKTVHQGAAFGGHPHAPSRGSDAWPAPRVCGAAAGSKLC